MSKKEREFYCKIGQAICNIFGAMAFFIVPIAGCIIAESIYKIIL